MRIGEHYKLVDLDITVDDVEKLVGNNLQDASIEGSSGYTTRSSKINWITDYQLQKKLLNFTTDINKDAGWNFDIDVLEPLQYTVYTEGDQYGWHQDQSPRPYDDGRIRKISFSLMLGDDFEGGEFDIETGHPEQSPRYETINLKNNQAIFFKSEYWHRVRPVTSGTRKSLVGWILGVGV